MDRKISVAIFTATTQVEHLADKVAHGIPAGTDSLLRELDRLEKAISALKQVRQAVLRHEIEVIGTPWERLARETGLHPSTWRYRLYPGIKGVKR